MHAELAAIAAAQDGLVTLEQLRLLVPSERERRRLVRTTGWLRRAAPGVYEVAGAPVTHRSRLRLGLLSLGERSWISYEAAAALHGFDRSDRTAVEFTIERRARVRRADGVVHTTAMLRPIDHVVVDGLRVMSATRTILDLAHARSWPARVEAAIDSAVRLELSSPLVIADRLTTLRGSGRWGCRLIDELLVDSGGHTMLERRFLEIVRRSGLERPRTQVIHRKGGRHIARVDFYFEQSNVVVEVTGRHGHSSPTERARDAQRRNELQDLGRKVFEYTWEDVTTRAPMVAHTLRARTA